MKTDEKGSVLVVDDSEPILDVLVGILGDIYQVSVAMDGETALGVVAETPPDLILLDIIMPGMNGYDVLKRLKSNPTTRSIPVIFVTAKNDVMDEALGFEIGCVDYITKPFNPHIVTARVKSHIDLLRARRELEFKNRELEKASRLKEEVDKMTIHDLKNPLSGILSGADYLLEFCDLDPEETETAEIVKEAALKMLSMINSSLDIFKMEQGLYRLRAEPVDLAVLVRRIAGEFKSLMSYRNVSLSLKIGCPQPPSNGKFPVIGEELLCYSMLSNLIKNGVEASPDGGIVTVNLSLAGNEALVQIHNRGAVPEAIRSTFFDKFVTHGKSMGTGLGTYSARLIAQTLKGSITMESDRVSGTTVSICLPRG